MDIFKDNERTAGMKQGGHLPSEPKRVGRWAGWRYVIRGGRCGNFRPYGATALAFNATRSARHVRDTGPSFAAGAADRCRGDGRGATVSMGILMGAALLGLIGATMPAAARVPVILDFGDSLTAGHGLPAGQAFPARLEAWLHLSGIGARVVNAGVSGDTTADGVARLDWALADKP